jgi:hypothetical protein
MLRNIGILLTAAAALATATDMSLRRQLDLPTVRRPPFLLPGPEDALTAALKDADKIDAYHRPFVRYVYLDGGQIEDLKALSIAVNTVSRASVLIRPWPVNRLLARLDLRKYAPQDDDLDDWLRHWEEMKYDPLFSRLITKDEAAGQKHAVVLSNSPAVEPAMTQLQYLLYTEAPIVSARYLQFRILSSFKGQEELYDTVFGGRYYEFVGIKRSKDKKFTDEDLFFKRLGLEPPAAKLFDQLHSDQRAAFKRSKITGKTRVVIMFHTPSGRETTGWGAISNDIRTEDVDLGTDPIANLLNAKSKAKEAIFEKPNGLHVYALFDGDGKLLDFADANSVVSDRTVPPPHVALLQACISCMACHEADGSDGWKDMDNEVKKFLAKRFDVFDDLSRGRKQGQPDVIDRIAGLYAGDFTDNLRQARNDYAKMVLKAAGPWPRADQRDIVKVAVGSLVEKTRSWWYTAVDSRTALRELGIDPGDEDAAAVLRQAVPPDRRSEYLGLIPEDARIGFLLEGLNVPRHEWAFTISFAAERAVPYRNKLAAEIAGRK